MHKDGEDHIDNISDSDGEKGSNGKGFGGVF